MRFLLQDLIVLGFVGSLLWLLWIEKEWFIAGMLFGLPLLGILGQEVISWF